MASCFRRHSEAARDSSRSAGLSDCDPIYVTMDDGVRCVGATRTSRQVLCNVDGESARINAHFVGPAEVAAQYRLFSEAGDAPEPEPVDVLAFDGSITVKRRQAGGR